jgi:hypothetical protein
MPCCSVLALVRVRSAGCPARESVAACRGCSCRCGPAADRTPALQDGSTSLHLASARGHAAVVQTLLELGADVAATNKVGAAGVPRVLTWRCARECLHAMCVCAMVCMEMCARNRARLCCCAGAAACGEVERGMEMVRTCMPCCNVLALVRVRSAGCPARESVAACRGRSCRCGPASPRTR